MAIANGAAALLSVGASLLALVKPDVLLPTGSEATPLVTFYAQAYAARALPIGAAVLALLAGRDRGGLPAVLAVAGLAQAGDALIGAGLHNPGMVAGSSVGAVIHLVSAYRLRARP